MGRRAERNSWPIATSFVVVGAAATAVGVGAFDWVAPGWSGDRETAAAALMVYWCLLVSVMGRPQGSAPST